MGTNITTMDRLGLDLSPERVTSTLDYISEAENVQTAVIACGMIDGLEVSTLGNAPFIAFSDMLYSATKWYFSYRLMLMFSNRFAVSQRWFALIPAFSVVSLIYRKYAAATQPKKKKQEEDPQKGLLWFEHKSDGTYILSIGGRRIV